MSQIITQFSEISQNYRAAFVDLWGCVHNGVTAFEEAVKALQEFRAEGGIVVLVTNSPRPRAQVAEQLVHFNVPNDAWDTIATSGDSARVALFLGTVGDKVHFIGTPDEQEAFFTAPAVLDNPRTITPAPLSEAEGIVCTGPLDPLAPIEDNRPTLLQGVARGMKLLCANPDIIVDRGERREWCAGAVAQLYTDMGGESLYFGKPHPPIYDLARRRLAQIDPSIADQDIIAIGDGINTDVQGAVGENLDVLFITGGLAKAETQTQTQPAPQALQHYLTQMQLFPKYSIGYLR
jgi:HAD superfamily hydrolase (TIGR01459 family)